MVQENSEYLICNRSLKTIRFCSVTSEYSAGYGPDAAGIRQASIRCLTPLPQLTNAFERNGVRLLARTKPYTTSSQSGETADLRLCGGNRKGNQSSFRDFEFHNFARSIVQSFERSARFPRPHRG